MRLALSSTELRPGEGVEALRAQAVRLGVEYVELWHPTHTGGDPGHAVDLLAEAGVRVCCVGSPTELCHGAAAGDTCALMEAIELAARAGAPFANLYFGWAEARDDARAIDAFRRYLDPCLEAAARQGVTLVLENEFNAFGWDPAETDVSRRPESLARLFEAVGDPAFRLTWDPSNAYCAGVEPFPHSYEVLRPYIAYVHVKDCRRLLPDAAAPAGWKVYRDYGRAYATAPLGQGAVNWTGILERLAADGYDGFLTLEPHADAPCRDAAWAHAAGWLRARGAVREG
ncbi:MAG TPA: sugar phosphate isomerase/epimerase family protein [Longimicrobium sp.]|nr:sugar phosphate isomerase/epimerase family protein [Longimicrobium sp.]